MTSKKQQKKGRGFSKITSTRLTRSDKKQLQKDLDNLVLSLYDNKGITKADIEKKATLLQSSIRGRATRKQLPEKIKSMEKYREKKSTERIGSKFYKTLGEIPPLLLDKLLSSTIEKYNIQDTEIKNILVARIIGQKYSNQFNNIVDIIIEINKHIINYLDECIRHLGLIINYNTYPSSADEDEIYRIENDFRDDIINLRNKISRITRKLIPLVAIRDKIITEYDNILSTLTTGETDMTSPLNVFIDTVNIDWLEELDKADIHRNNSVSYLDNKIDEMQEFGPKYAETAKVSFAQAISATLVLTHDKNLEKFASNFNKSFEKIDKEYSKFSSLHGSQKSKTTKTRSRR